MELAIIYIASLVWLTIVARLIWRVQQKQDPMTAIIPTIMVSKAKQIPKVLAKAERTQARQNYINDNG